MDGQFGEKEKGDALDRDGGKRRRVERGYRRYRVELLEAPSEIPEHREGWHTRVHGMRFVAIGEWIY
jgi:hypothetical protein